MGCTHSAPSTSTNELVVADPKLDERNAFMLKWEIHTLKADLYGKTITNLGFACQTIICNKSNSFITYKGLKNLEVTEAMEFDWNVLPAFFQLEKLVINVPCADYVHVLLGDNFLDQPFICPSVREVCFYQPIHFLSDFDFLTLCFPNLNKIRLHEDQVSSKLKRFCEDRQQPIKMIWIDITN